MSIKHLSEEQYEDRLFWLMEGVAGRELRDADDAFVKAQEEQAAGKSVYAKEVLGVVVAEKLDEISRVAEELALYMRNHYQKPRAM